jgi:opacity protein-like surface antigen
MKQILLIAGLLITLTNAFSQDGLDDIFDDGDKNSKFSIGTEVLTLAGGTPNIYLDYTPIELITLKLGLGIMPFHKHIDAVLFRDHEVTLDSVSSGRFYDLNIKFNTQPSKDVDFKYYYYLGYKKWSYNYLQDIAVTRTKASFGLGYNFGLTGRFNLDLKFGVGFIMGKATTNSLFESTHDIPTNFLNYSLYDNNDTDKRTQIGIDVGIGINYAL